MNTNNQEPCTTACSLPYRILSTYIHRGQESYGRGIDPCLRCFAETLVTTTTTTTTTT